MFYIYLKQNDNQKADEALKDIMQSDTSTIKNVDIIENIYDKSGIIGILNWLIERELKKSEPNPAYIARYYALLNNNEEALNWLEKAIEKHYLVDIPWVMNNNPDYESLRSLPRYKRLIEKMGLSDYQTPK